MCKIVSSTGALKCETSGFNRKLNMGILEFSETFVDL